MRLDIEDFNGAAAAVRSSHGDAWPWTVIGVFPAPETEMTDGWWNRFCYTVGLEMELWAPCCSIEGRCMDFDLTAMILNRLAAGVLGGQLQSGDDVVVPLGVAGQEDADDVESIWWVGEPDTRTRRQTFQSPALLVLPVLWSSPLGFEYVTKTGKVLGVDELDELADEAERGYDVTGLHNRGTP